ncbi:MAG: multicopper oxidase domain-containing protein [Acidobacteriota bacterium]
MAGYLIVEGEDDDNINCRFTGRPDPNLTLKTGPWDYRERLMFMQRVFPANIEGDPDAAPTSRLKKAPIARLNGSEKAGVINMRPGAVERWRVINGSVDGRGYKRFMVVKGHYDIVTTGFAPTVAEADVPRPEQAIPVNMLVKVGADGKPILEPVTPAELEAAKCHLFQLSIDGITLVRTVEQGGKQVPEYYIKDLAKQFYSCPAPGPGEPMPKVPVGILGPTPRPACRDSQGNEVPVDTPNARKLRGIENLFKDAESIRNAWVRPNEFYMGPANRTDLFFQLPPDAKCGDVFTVLAKAVAIHADTPVFSLQESVNCPNASPGPSDIIVAHIVVVDEQPVSGLDQRPKSVPLDQSFDWLMKEVQDCLPDEVLPYLRPITDEELAIQSGSGSGKYRTRVSYYSGWGNEGMPLVTTDANDPNREAFLEFIEGKNRETPNGPELRDLRYMWLNENGNVVPEPERPSKSDIAVLLSPRTRTMGINHGTQPTEGEPGRDEHLRGRKFNPNDPTRPFVLVNTCEEWAVYNTSQTLWGFTDTSEAGQAKHPQPGQFRGHYISYPLTRRQGQQEFWKCSNLDTESGIPDFRVVSRAIDHPFHIHQNPFWVLRIEIPDENGNLVNILPEPRWMDTSWIPRNNGRIVFRSRFPDYVGVSVHHCHVLQHEDNGMMTAWQLTPFPELANPEKRARVADANQPCEQNSEDVDRIYPRPTLKETYVRNFTFLDPNLPAAKDPSLPKVYIAPKPGEETKVPNTGQNYPGFKVQPPDWPPRKGPRKGT